MISRGGRLKTFYLFGVLGVLFSSKPGAARRRESLDHGGFREDLPQLLHAQEHDASSSSRSSRAPPEPDDLQAPAAASADDIALLRSNSKEDTGRGSQAGSGISAGEIRNYERDDGAEKIGPDDRHTSAPPDYEVEVHTSASVVVASPTADASHHASATKTNVDGTPRPAQPADFSPPEPGISGTSRSRVQLQTQRGRRDKSRTKPRRPGSKTRLAGPKEMDLFAAASPTTRSATNSKNELQESSFVELGVGKTTKKTSAKPDAQKYLEDIADHIDDTETEVKSFFYRDDEGEDFEEKEKLKSRGTLYHPPIMVRSNRVRIRRYPDDPNMVSSRLLSSGDAVTRTPTPERDGWIEIDRVLPAIGGGFNEEYSRNLFPGITGQRVRAWRLHCENCGHAIYGSRLKPSGFVPVDALEGILYTSMERGILHRPQLFRNQALEQARDEFLMKFDPRDLGAASHPTVAEDRMVPVRTTSEKQMSASTSSNYNAAAASSALERDVEQDETKETMLDEDHDAHGDESRNNFYHSGEQRSYHRAGLPEQQGKMNRWTPRKRNYDKVDTVSRTPIQPPQKSFGAKQSMKSDDAPMKIHQDLIFSEGQEDVVDDSSHDTKALKDEHVGTKQLSTKKYDIDSSSSSILEMGQVREDADHGKEQMKILDQTRLVLPSGMDAVVDHASGDKISLLLSGATPSTSSHSSSTRETTTPTPRSVLQLEASSKLDISSSQNEQPPTADPIQTPESADATGARRTNANLNAQGRITIAGSGAESDNGSPRAVTGAGEDTSLTRDSDVDVSRMGGPRTAGGPGLVDPGNTDQDSRMNWQRRNIDDKMTTLFSHAGARLGLAGRNQEITGSQQNIKPAASMHDLANRNLDTGQLAAGGADAQQPFDSSLYTAVATDQERRQSLGHIPNYALTASTDRCDAPGVCMCIGDDDQEVSPVRLLESSTLHSHNEMGVSSLSDWHDLVCKDQFFGASCDFGPGMRNLDFVGRALRRHTTELLALLKGRCGPAEKEGTEENAQVDALQVFGYGCSSTGCACVDRGTNMILHVEDWPEKLDQTYDQYFDKEIDRCVEEHMREEERVNEAEAMNPQDTPMGNFLPGVFSGVMTSLKGMLESLEEKRKTMRSKCEQETSKSASRQDPLFRTRWVEELNADVMSSENHNRACENRHISGSCKIWGIQGICATVTNEANKRRELYERAETRAREVEEKVLAEDRRDPMSSEFERVSAKSATALRDQDLTEARRRGIWAGRGSVPLRGPDALQDPEQIANAKAEMAHDPQFYMRTDESGQRIFTQLGEQLESTKSALGRGHFRAVRFTDKTLPYAYAGYVPKALLGETFLERPVGGENKFGGIWEDPECRAVVFFFVISTVMFLMGRGPPG